MRTHPLTGDRISHLEADLRGDPAWDNAPDVDLPEADLVARVEVPLSSSPDDATPAPVEFGSCITPAPAPAQAQSSELERRFQLAKAKLYGYLAEPRDTLRVYPTTMTTGPARYARAYAYHKDARIDQALAECDALVASAPDNPYFLELKGQILLESGKPVEALVPLRQAVELTGNEPLIAGTFGHALLATEDRANLDEAENVLRAAVGRDRENPFACLTGFFSPRWR